jgi:TPR repeat protein
LPPMRGNGSEHHSTKMSKSDYSLNMRTLFIIALLLVSLVSSPSWGADFDKGFAAYDRGDFEIALRKWTPLAEQGDADAQFNLGFMYRNGFGVLQDYKTTVKWYTRAAEQGYGKAQVNLGIMYGNGSGNGYPLDVLGKWMNTLSGA